MSTGEDLTHKGEVAALCGSEGSQFGVATSRRSIDL